MFVGLVGRIAFVVVPLIVMPPFARYVDPARLGPLVALTLMVVLYVARNILFRIAIAVPWPDPTNRMICSEFARRVIHDTFGPGALPGLGHVSPSMTSPGDLLQALLQRSHYGDPSGQPVPDATTDNYPRPATQQRTG